MWTWKQDLDSTISMPLTRDESFRRRVISLTGLWVGTFIIITVICRNYLAVLDTGVILRTVILALLLLAMPGFIRLRFSTKFCGGFFVFCLFLIGLNGGFGNAGMIAPSSVIFVIMPITGFFFDGNRGARFAVFLSFTAIAVLLLGEQYSLTHPIRDLSKYSLYKSIIYACAIVCTYALGAAYERARRFSETIQEQLIHTSRLSSLGEMAGGMAHEINNPLAIIHARATQLKRRVKDGTIDVVEFERHLDQIVTTSERIDKIIKALRLFSRNADADPMEIVDVSQIIEETVELCKERYRDSGVDFRVGQATDITLECRSVQISQILMNLLNNSFDAISELPDKWIQLEVVLKVVKDTEILKISVTDAGNGIPIKIVEKMMDPFFTTKEIGKGTGLGLSIVKGIMDSHHGKFYYDSSSKNTRFVLELPLRQPKSLAA